MATPAKGKKTNKGKRAARPKSARRTTKKKATLAKYEQAGAPWWKRTPLPEPKS